MALSVKLPPLLATPEPRSRRVYALSTLISSFQLSMIFADYVEENKTDAVCGGKLSQNDTIALIPQWSTAPSTAFSSEEKNCVTVQTDRPVSVIQQLVVRWYSTVKKQTPERTHHFAAASSQTGRKVALNTYLNGVVWQIHFRVPQWHCSLRSTLFD